jgi:hypothetical protein
VEVDGKNEGRPEKSGGGRSLAEAVGELISSNFEMKVWLGLEIINEIPPVQAEAQQKK